MTRLLKKYKRETTTGDDSVQSTSSKPYNLEEARDDQVLSELKSQLRYFLTTSTLYEPISILQFLIPIKDFLSKEHAILRMKLGNIKECFTILFSERRADGSIDDHTIKFA